LPKAQRKFTEVGIGKMRCVGTGPNGATDFIAHFQTAQNIHCAFPPKMLVFYVFILFSIQFLKAHRAIGYSFKFVLSAFSNNSM
jgi:hypothetical protein